MLDADWYRCTPLARSAAEWTALAALDARGRAQAAAGLGSLLGLFVVLALFGDAVRVNFGMSLHEAPCQGPVKKLPIKDFATAPAGS